MPFNEVKNHSSMVRIAFFRRIIRPIETHGANSWRLANKMDTVLMKRGRKMLEKY
jgi:hypothetical protein